MSDRNGSSDTRKPAGVTGRGPVADPVPTPPLPAEIGGPAGPEPTRYGDWEVGGRCSDF